LPGVPGAAGAAAAAAVGAAAFQSGSTWRSKAVAGGSCVSATAARSAAAHGAVAVAVAAIFFSRQNSFH